jgi:D-alanyl-D-alanine carboxypeptidase/D-alanyl-D-alanine-endopeptidase (penicillin-binding protein 4)
MATTFGAVNAPAQASARAIAHVRHHAQSASSEGIEIINLQTGAVEMSVNDAGLFNPASNTKLATTLFVLEQLGPDYRFPTTVSTDGKVDANGVLQGNLYIDGRYMLFGDRQMEELAGLLNAKGIKSVKGNVYVSSQFTTNLLLNGAQARAKLLADLDPAHALTARHRRGTVAHPLAVTASHVAVSGTVKEGSAPAGATLLATHMSPPMKDIIKIMLCYSDNTMAMRFGEILGGPKVLMQLVITKLGVPAAEVSFSTTSGLDVNRISPRAMIKVVTALRDYLEQHQLSLADLLPVAGIDAGTMYNRLKAPGQAGSVIAKTGTLVQTDNGASALSGEIHTTGDGKYLFVIFEMNGSVPTFRQRQNQVVTAFQASHGGPQPITYTPIIPRVDGEDYWI